MSKQTSFSLNVISVTLTMNLTCKVNALQWVVLSKVCTTIPISRCACHVDRGVLNVKTSIHAYNAKLMTEA